VENRITQFDDRREQPADIPPTIGQVLAELLAQYQVRFPQVRITLVETPAAVV
jgi:DNA-binding transcriptional LysR family regulator